MTLIALCATGAVLSRSARKPAPVAGVQRLATNSEFGSYHDYVPEILPPSAKSAAIARYANYPVDYSTGAVNIEIPLYTIRAKDLVLPITLSYHASGIRIDDRDGKIGLGWTLNAEPMISRSVRGTPDEKGYLDETWLYDEDPNYLKGIADQWRDGQPDEFSYRLLNKSGNFYFAKARDSSNTIITGPYEPLKITIDTTRPSQERFQVLDEYGTRYDFDSLEVTEVIEGKIAGTTGWKATKITSPNGLTSIRMKYKRGEEYCYMSNDRITVQDKLVGRFEGVLPLTVQLPFVRYFTEGKTPVNYFANGSSHQLEVPVNAINGLDNQPVEQQYFKIHTQELESITYRGGRVDFIYSADKRLSEIKVYNNTETLPIRTILLSRAPFLSLGPNGTLHSSVEDKYRYRLDGVTIKDGASVVQEKYRFDYFEYEALKKPTKSGDHWGYFNGSTLFDTQNAVPKMEISGKPQYFNEFSFQIGDETHKEPNESYMKYGTLRRITYPTGRTSTFAYEAHRYSAGGQARITGGLRIRDIEEYDPVSDRSVYRVFKYGENGNGFGYPYYVPTNSDYMLEQTMNYKTAGSTLRLRTFYSQPLCRSVLQSVSPVSYAEVREYVSTADGTQTPVNYTDGVGWTLYRYDTGVSGVSRVEGAPYYWVSAQRYGAPKLLKKENYDNQGKLVTSTDYQYRLFKKGSAYARILFYKIMPVLRPGDDARIGDYDFWDVHRGDLYVTGARKLETETLTEKMPDGDIVTAKTYTYDDEHELQLKSVSQPNSRGEIVKTGFNYAKDCPGTAYQRMILLNRIYEVVEEATSTGTLETARIKKIPNFNNNIVQNFSVNSCAGGQWRQELYVDCYTADGNVREYQYLGKPLVTQLWGYNDQYPIASIENAGFLDIHNVGIPLNETNAIAKKGKPTLADFNRIEGLRTTVPFATKSLISTYRYAPLTGMSMKSDPAGRSRYYQYDNYGRLGNTSVMDGERGLKSVEEYQYNYINK